MRLRWKFFLLLLAFSLIPLTAVTLIIQWGTSRMGDAISEHVGQDLTLVTYDILKLTAESSATILERGQKVFEFALAELVSEAEAVFAEEPPGSLKAFFASDFEDPRTAPADFAPRSSFWKTSTDGRLVEWVSYDHPVVLLAPDVAASEVQDEIDRLTLLSDVFADIGERLGQELHWAYVSTETGVHVSFPGHGGYPVGYDPRKRSWYTDATHEIRWTLPMVDATSGQVILTAFRQFHHPDGSVAGVAAMDVLITQVLRVSALSSVWTSAMRSFLVTPAVHPQTEDTGLLIVAQKDYQTRNASWEGGIETEWLDSEQQSSWSQMVSDLSRGRSGYLQMPYKGIASIWAFAPINEKSYFVIVVPKSVVDRAAEKTTRIARKFTDEELLIAAVAAAGAILMATLAALMLSRDFTGPILELVSAVGRLSGGDFTVRVHSTTGDERDRVIWAFNEMVPRLEDHLRLRESLQLATEVQQNLLPRQDPRFPGLDISGISLYCDETGGDYYDFLKISKGPAGRFVVVVGDVSGHGIYSALLMASARASLRLRAFLPGTLADMVRDVNRQFTRDVGDSGSFMTLFILGSDPTVNTLSWVRAGHDPAICYDPQVDSFEELSGSGPALGFDEDAYYEEREKTDLKPGQIVFIGTDGIWETANARGEMFGKVRLGTIIRNKHSGSAQEIVQAVLSALEDFRQPLKPADDVTMVVIKVSQPEYSRFVAKAT
jgi:phosphoserine phosphatase RsbU/P